MSRSTLAKVAALTVLSLAVGTTACSDDDPIAPATSNIVQTAIDAGSFNTLVTAVQTAGLENTLATDGPFTVFAPTDAAFDALPDGTLEALLDDPDALADILTYHVVSGEFLAEDVAELTSVTTLQGSELAIDTSNGVQVGGANVVTTDVLATNGVIHVIDAVLIP